ncbi:MAG: ThuA domain-containing protein [Opitutaceae bacterium]
MKISPILTFIFLLSLMLNTAMANKAELPAIEVLIVDGFSNHDWEATTEDIKRLLKRDSGIRYEVSTVPAEDAEGWATWLPDFKRYDVVIQNTTDIRVGGSWPCAAQIALEEYVSGGGGLYIFHSANNAFPEWTEYNRMIGLGWRKKNFGPAVQIVDGQQVLIPTGEGGNTGHGKRLDTIITRMNDHPIHAGLPLQWLAADLEIYFYARGPAENLTVISYAWEPKTKLNFPIEWVIDYGQGRVFNSTYGHHMHHQKETPAGLRCVAFETIFNRAIYWLAQREVDPELPENFPSTTETSLSADSTVNE